MNDLEETPKTGQLMVETELVSVPLLTTIFGRDLGAFTEELMKNLISLCEDAYDWQPRSSLLESLLQIERSVDQLE